jgi:cell division protease FtsH
MHTPSLESKKIRLDEASRVLKSTFFGIDTIIDQVISGINSWYFFAEYQTRPRIINLWGMTGVGKSDLVKTLVEVLELDADFYSFDCGEMVGKNINLVREALTPLNELRPVRPQVLFFDEFQLMRSINEEGNEHGNENARAVWNLLDSGILKMNQSWFMINERVYMIYRELKYQIQNGVIIEKGLVSEDQEDFLISKHAEKYQNLTSVEWKEFISKPKNRMALNSSEIGEIFELPNLKLLTKGELEAKIKKLNGQELLSLLKKELELYSKPGEVNLSNALIFVAGNLDEVYTFSTSQSPDISPDYYHTQSLKITIQDVKKALLKRFRVEQVARLGNLHLIYASLTTKAYTEIINQELARIQNWTFQRSGIQFIFLDQVRDWIFREGVAPTQGVRPLKSSIRYTVEDQIFSILADASLQSESVEEVVLDYEEGNLLVNFRSGNKNVAQKTYPVVEKIAQLRKGKRDEQQALTAVHESGHAVAHLALFHQAPELVLSVAAEAGSMGLAVLPEMEILNLENMKRRTAVLLAGLEAERLIFGEDLISAGSYGDIETATSMVIRLLKESGFGGSSIRYASAFSENAETYHDIPEIENLAKSILEEAKERVQEVLIQEKILLLQMASILSEHSSLSSQEVDVLVTQYGSESLKTRMNQKEPSYKELLNLKVLELERHKKLVYGEN